MSTYPKWLREAAARGGKKSRRKLTKKQAREMVKARERKRAPGGGDSPTDKMSHCEPEAARGSHQKG